MGEATGNQKNLLGYSSRHHDDKNADQGICTFPRVGPDKMGIKIFKNIVELKFKKNIFELKLSENINLKLQISKKIVELKMSKIILNQNPFLKTKGLNKCLNISTTLGIERRFTKKA